MELDNLKKYIEILERKNKKLKIKNKKLTKEILESKHYELMHIARSLTVKTVIDGFEKIINEYPDVLHDAQTPNKNLIIYSFRNYNRVFESKVIKFLLQKGSPLNIRNNFGLLPIDNWIDNENELVINLLIKAGSYRPGACDLSRFNLSIKKLISNFPIHSLKVIILRNIYDKKIKIKIPKNYPDRLLRFHNL